MAGFSIVINVTVKIPVRLQYARVGHPTPIPHSCCLIMQTVGGGGGGQKLHSCHSSGRHGLNSLFSALTKPNSDHWVFGGYTSGLKMSFSVSFTLSFPPLPSFLSFTQVNKFKKKNFFFVCLVGLFPSCSFV